MNENGMGFTHSHEEAKAMVHKAIQMAGRTLSITHPPKLFSWEQMAEELIEDWKVNPMHYQMIVEMEDNVIQFAVDALLDWVEIQAMGG